MKCFLFHLTHCFQSMTECVSKCKMEKWRTFHRVSPAVDFYQVMPSSRKYPYLPPTEAIFSKTPSPTPFWKLSSYLPYNSWPWKVPTPPPPPPPTTLRNFLYLLLAEYGYFLELTQMHVSDIMNQNFFANLMYLMIDQLKGCVE